MRRQRFKVTTKVERRKGIKWTGGKVEMYKGGRGGQDAKLKRCKSEKAGR